MVCGRRVYRALFGALVLVGVIWLSTVGIIANRADKISMMMERSTEAFRYWKSIGREKYTARRHYDLNYVSRRRVPKGPDPIHNRRAGKTKRPPGRA